MSASPAQASDDLRKLSLQRELRACIDKQLAAEKLKDRPASEHVLNNCELQYNEFMASLTEERAANMQKAIEGYIYEQLHGDKS